MKEIGTKHIINIIILLVLVGGQAISQQKIVEAVGVPPSDIILEASQHLGKSYQYGGKGPSSFDCAGFVQYVFKQNGISLPPSCTHQYQSGKHINKRDLEVGDLVFFGGRKQARSIGHVGIVTSVDTATGVFQFIHASRTGVRYSKSNEDYYNSRYISACRVLTDLSDMPQELPKIDMELALDLYPPDENAVFSYMAGESVDTWIQTHGLPSEWVEVSKTDTIIFQLSHTPQAPVDPETEALFRLKYYEQDNLSVGLCEVSYEGHCQREWHGQQVMQAVRSLRDSVDVMIVSFRSSDDDILEAQTFAHLCVGWGADMVCCHGIENVHTIEMYEGRLIAYGLGNECTLGKEESLDNVSIYLKNDGSLLGGKIGTFVKHQISTSGKLSLGADGSFIQN